MIFLTPLLSILSCFCLHYLWKYFEKEFGIITSLLSISIVIITFYGAYIYFKKSLYIEIDFGKFANKKEDFAEFNSNLMLSVFERYNRERENYLSGGLVTVKQGEDDPSEIKNKKFVSQSETHSSEMKDTDILFHDSKLSFFGLSMNSPNTSKKLYQHNNCYNSSHKIYSPSLLADTFIQAADIARNYQSEHYRGIHNNSQLQNSNILIGSNTNTLAKAAETKNSNSRLFRSVGYSFHSNIEFARSRFEDYISSLQFRITNKRVRNSLPGRLLSSVSNSESGVKKNAISKHRKSSIPSILIESVDDKSTKAKANSSTPTRKIYNSFLSPLPTSKPSPILLFTDNKN